MSELERLAVVFDALESAGISSPVFVGGSIVSLLLTDQATHMPRATEDVDVVLEIETAARYALMTQKLIAAGYQPDPYGPTCRWIIEGVPADIMPLEESILGFANRWYRELFVNSLQVHLPSGQQVRVASAPYLVATKLEAFNSRGDNDLRMSEDITDIVSVLDGRPELCRELAAADFEVRHFVQKQFQRLVEHFDFLADFQAHLPRDPFSSSRTPEIRQRILNVINNDC